MLKKIICFFFGHSFFVLGSKRNEHSEFGFLRCSRCPKEEQFQCDFV